MPDFSNPELSQCQDCGHHFQISPRGEIQGGACPDCGGKRMFRMQPNPVQSEGTLRNMVDMETGKDAGGNPDGEGILAPPSGRAILAEFMNAPIDMMQGQCRHCGGDVLEFPDGRRTCEHCGAPFETDASSGIPDELRGQIAGAPLTEGTIMQTEHTDPLDTGAHGRDEYTHGHVLAVFLENDPHTHCPECGHPVASHPAWPDDPNYLVCPHCKLTYDPKEWHGMVHGMENTDVIEHPDPFMDNEPGSLTIPQGHPALWPKAAAEGEHQGWTNYETWHTKAMLDNDRHLYEHQKKMSEEGWTPEQIRDWTVKHVIGPENKRKLEDAREWNEIPEAEHTGPHYEEVAEKGPQHKEIMESWFEGPDLSDTSPNLIDPKLVNWDEIHHNIHAEHQVEPEGVSTPVVKPQVPEPQLDQPGKDVFPSDWTSKTAGEMEDIVGLDTPSPKNNLNWSPGMKGRGIVIGGEPHTWNAFDPNKVWKSGDTGLFHPQYVESLGVNPEHVDWNSGVEIEPDGRVSAVGGHNAAPFIAADPRLKHVEEKFFPFGPTMPITSRTNNMEPYESLWAREADVQFDQGPLQNTSSPSPAYSVVVQPSDAGVHGAHTGQRGLLSFLDAHINGIPVRGHGGELITKYGFRSSPDFGKPLVVAVHDPAHLPTAVEAIQHPNGRSSLIDDLVPKIQSGEVTAPPGIDPQTLQPSGGMGFTTEPESITARTAGMWGDLGAAALTAGGLALAVPTGGADLPEVAAGDAALLGGGAAAEGAGAAGAADAAGASGTAGGLMSKAMSGAGGLAKAEGISNLVGQGAGMGEKALGLGGGGGEGGGGGAGYSGPLQQFTHVLAAFVESDYETPASNPDVGVKHDDPEDVDQKEFNDQDKSPENPMNPNLQDSGASGEDEVRKNMDKPSQGQFSPDSPGIQRMEMLMPLIEKYYHSDESGASDPMLQGLHEMLEAENPGYLNGANAEAAERFMHNKKKPEHVHAGTTHEAIMPPMQQGNLTAQQQALDPTGLNPSQQPQPGAPSSQTPPGGGAQQGHCATCGGVTQADGSCPQCGAAAAPSAQPLPGGPSQVPHPQTFAHTDLLASFVDSANHQGPVTPEQIAAVQQWLIQEGRVDEVPNVPLDPGNPEYAKILAEVQHNPMNPPPVTPEEQTQPPAPQPAAPGGMPVPGMAPGEAGGQPMQPMSSFLPDFTAADNVAPRCPKCGSGTTGLVGDQDHNARCHSCQNVWKLGDLVSDENYGQTSIARTALRDERQHGGDEQANPIGVPAAEQEGQTNQGGDEDSSLTWKDSTGAPLKAGQQYQMVNPSFALPDLVRVERVKPDGVDLTLLGTYANDPGQHDPNTLTSSTPLSRQDMEMQHISFEPVGQNADEQNNEPPPGSAAPGHAQVPPSGQTTDEQAASEPQMAAQSSVDPDCPRCGHREFTSSMITPEATEHSCFRCGHDWVTEEKGLEREAGIDLEWLNEDDDADDLSPRRTEMARAAVQSRSIGDIAEKDERLRAVREHLEHEKEARTERLAGKHFTPREQRELIDEDGIARNSDMLDLAGTHYKVRDDYESKTNPERVRDADLFLGI